MSAPPDGNNSDISEASARPCLSTKILNAVSNPLFPAAVERIFVITVGLTWPDARPTCNSVLNFESFNLFNASIAWSLKTAIGPSLYIASAAALIPLVNPSAPNWSFCLINKFKAFALLAFNWLRASFRCPWIVFISCSVFADFNFMSYCLFNESTSPWFCATSCKPNWTAADVSFADCFLSPK